MYKLAVLPLLFAVASAGLIGAPIAAPLAYSAPAVASYSTHTVAASPLAYAAPVAYSAPAVVKTVAPVATSYQNTYKISRSAVAAVATPVAVAAPAVTYAAAAPAVATYAAAPVYKTAIAAPLAYSAPAVATYAHAPAVATYAHAPAVATYAAAPALSYSTPLLKTAHLGYAPTLLH